MAKLTGNYFKKQFAPPRTIGSIHEELEEITIFPTNDEDDGFIDFKLTKGQEEVIITFSFNGKEWKGTMKELSKKLK